MFYTYSDVIGAMLSMFAIRIPASAIRLVSSRARIGSPCMVVTPKTFRNGMTPSLAMACSSLGAPSKVITHSLLAYCSADLQLNWESTGQLWDWIWLPIRTMLVLRTQDKAKTRQLGILRGWSGHLNQSPIAHSFVTYIINFQKHAQHLFTRS